MDLNICHLRVFKVVIKMILRLKECEFLSVQPQVKKGVHIQHTSLLSVEFSVKEEVLYRKLNANIRDIRPGFYICMEGKVFLIERSFPSRFQEIKAVTVYTIHNVTPSFGIYDIWYT